MADEQIQELRVRNDQICEELGLPKFQRDEQKRSRGMSNAEYYTASKGESWKFELMRVIDECMRCAGNREEFLALLRRRRIQRGIGQMAGRISPTPHRTDANAVTAKYTYRKIPERKHGGGIWIQNGE